MPLGTEQLMKMMGCGREWGGQTQHPTKACVCLTQAFQMNFVCSSTNTSVDHLVLSASLRLLWKIRSSENRKIYPRLLLIQPVKESPAQLFNKINQMTALLHTKPCKLFLIILLTTYYKITNILV